VRHGSGLLVAGGGRGSEDHGGVQSSAVEGVCDEEAKRWGCESDVAGDARLARQP